MKKKSDYEIRKFIDGDFELDVSVSPKEDTVWLSQKQMAALFNVSVDNISLHIKNILKDELDNSVIEESSITATDEKKYKVKLYNLDMIISVGYRVKSKNSINNDTVFSFYFIVYKSYAVALTTFTL